MDLLKKIKSKSLWRVLGILAFASALFLPMPAVMAWPARVVLGMTLWMAIYWISEAVPLAVASLIPLVVLPVFSVMPMDMTARFYADPNIFLFMGGFFLALAMEKCALQKRIALHLIRVAGSGPRGLLGGFLLATGFISMWVSNTATTMMMLPIALAVIEQLKRNPQGVPLDPRFATALMLGIAYASNIGGIATLVGTPPNMIFAGQAKALFPHFPEVSFVSWFLLCFPIAGGFLLITWVYLAWGVCGAMQSQVFDRKIIEKEIAALGAWSGDEKKVMTIFGLTVFAWIFRGDIPLGHFTLPGWASLLGIQGLHDGTVAIAAAILLFLIPSEKNQNDTLLNWAWAVKIPWGVLLLFGGGFALAEGFQQSGLAAEVARVFTGLEGQPLFLTLLILCLVNTFGSELMSNSPQVTIMMPVLASASASMHLHPYWLMIPATLMSSLAFMLPAGTPPNAIAFASGHVTMRQMVKTGFVLNVAASLWVSGMIFFLLPVFFDVK